jgi:hypothetical protein
MRKTVLGLSFILLAIGSVDGFASVGATRAASDSDKGAVHIEVGPNILASANIDKGGRNECWVTASKTDPNFLVAVCQATTGSPEDEAASGPRQCSTSISRNGGQTWREITLPDQEDGCFDVMGAAAPDGRVYLQQPMLGRNFGVDLGTNVARTQGVIKIYSTIDEGKTWRGPTTIDCPIAEDHPRMVVDDSNGPHRGRLYVEWNEVYDTVFDNLYHIVLQYSDDEGLTFSDAKLVATAVSDGGKLVATEPVVLSDGTLLVTYYQYWNPLSDPRNDHQPFYIARSTDGGKTFDPPKQVAEVGPSAWLYLRGEMSRAFTLPIIAADTSPASPYRDNVYMTWQDVSSGDADIWFIRSTDKGLTWSKPLRLNDNQPEIRELARQYRETPVVAVNKDGVVGVAWYDYRGPNAANLCWREFFAASLDGGKTFSANVPVSSEPSCPDEKALRPGVYVWNTSPYFEDTLPTQSEIDNIPRSDLVYQLRVAQDVALQNAFKAQEEKNNTAKIEVTFNYDRNLWPGHYSGLTADSQGVFHPFWSDRRNTIQQAYTARVVVSTSPDPPAQQTHEADVTNMVKLVGGAAKYDGAKGTTTFDLQLRNVSGQTIYAPLTVRIVQIESTSAGPTAEIVNADGKLDGTPAFDFSKLLGSTSRLDPKMISEAKKITVRTQAATGMDASFTFKVIGHLATSSAIH